MRRNSAQGGDAPLGNITTESMRQRRRVEAEFALTNTLGMRDHVYSGPVSLESLFNVFPFENTINIMYLSGAEVQELTNYVAERSAERGCQAQAQVSGIRFTMDCYQAQLNDQLKACKTAADCAPQFGGYIPKHEEGWRCREDNTCWANTSCGQPEGHRHGNGAVFVDDFPEAAVGERDADGHGEHVDECDAA